MLARKREIPRRSEQPTQFTLIPSVSLQRATDALTLKASRRDQHPSEARAVHCHEAIPTSCQPVF